MRQELSFYDIPIKTCKLLLYLKIIVITSLHKGSQKQSGKKLKHFRKSMKTIEIMHIKPEVSFFFAKASVTASVTSGNDFRSDTAP